MKTLIVTGASGLLGANFVIRARERGHVVVAASLRHALRAPGMRAVQVDLTDERATLSALAGMHADWIVHCAALTNVDWCEEHPETTYRVNAELPGRLARIARRAGSRLLYLSTDSVFAGDRGHYAEDDETGPVNEYSRSKLAGEVAVCKELPGRALVVRTNFFGWNMQPKESLAEWIVHRLEAGKQLNGFADVVFTPILANDLADLMLDMIEREHSGTYHVAGAEALSKYDFAVRLAAAFDLDFSAIGRTSVRSSHLKAPRPLDTSLACDRAARALGRALPDVASGIRRFCELRRSSFVTRLKGLAEDVATRDVAGE